MSAFGFPFRPGWPGAWLPGLACLLLLPLAFPLLFGYVAGVVRAAAADPAAGPPPWRVSARQVMDGLWIAAQLVVLTFPFAGAAWLGSSLLAARWRPAGDPYLDRAYALLVAGLPAALAWGLVCLVVVPPTLAAFAAGGRPRALADVGLVAHTLRHRFPEWNLAGAVIVTAWILALVSGGLLCAAVAGVYYAILVSAHACSTLAPGPSTRR